MSHTRKTSVAIDVDLAQAAQDALGTRSLRETIEQAFREVLAARAREEDIRAMVELRGLDLAEPAVLEAAWRS